jgi:regulatory protein
MQGPRGLTCEATALSARELLKRALRLLARREHSRAELSCKLLRLGASEQDTETLLDQLQASGKLSEVRLVEQTIAIRGKRYGPLKLQHELRAKGVSEAQIAAGLSESKAQELQAATAVWQRKFGQLPKSLQEKARQVRFLQNRGFSLNVIHNIMNNKHEEQ